MYPISNPLTSWILRGTPRNVAGFNLIQVLAPDQAGGCDAEVGKAHRRSKPELTFVSGIVLLKTWLLKVDRYSIERERAGIYRILHHVSAGKRKWPRLKLLLVEA